MKNYGNVMTLNALMTVYFGLGSLLFPTVLWGLYGLEAGSEGIWGLRFIGGLVLANLYLVWSSRSLESAVGRKLIANFVVLVWVFYGLLSLWGQVVGAFNLLNWTNIVGAALFAFLTFQARNGEPVRNVLRKAPTPPLEQD